jgi:hypothetical protein
MLDWTVVPIGVDTAFTHDASDPRMSVSDQDAKPF